MYMLTFEPGLCVADIIRQVRSNPFMHVVQAYARTTETYREDIEMTRSMLKLKADEPLLVMSIVAAAMDFQTMVMAPIEMEASEFLYGFYAERMSYIVTNRGMSELHEYIQLQCQRHLLVKVEIDGQYLIQEHEYEAQGFNIKKVKELITDVATWVPKKVKGMIGWSVDAVLDSFQEYFYKVITERIPMAMKVCSWVATVWDQIKTWIEDAMTAMSSFLQGCNELLTWGLATLAACCALNVLERILIFMEFLDESIDIAGIFLRTGVVAAACYHFSSTAKGFTEMMSVLSVATTAVAAVVCANYFGGSKTKKVNAQGNPVDLLERIAAGLSSISQDSLVSLGKSCSAINSIATSYGHLRNFAGRVLTMLRDFAWKILGLETRFLADAALVFGEDVDGWLQRISALREAYVSKAYSSQDEVFEMNVLLERGYKMRHLMATGSRVSPAIGNMLMQGLADLERLHRNAAVQGVKGVRKIPFTVFAHGNSRCGKSLLIGKLISDFQEHKGLGEDTVYSRNTTETHWSGYRRQPIVVIDDFAAVESDISAEAQLINLVSSTPYSVVMAAIEEKGMTFDSQFIFASTNFLEVSPNGKIRCDDAFRNRRHVLIDVKLKPEVEYQSDDFTANQSYNILEHSHGRYNVVATFDNYEELLAYCLTKHEQHEAEQEANLAKLRRTNKFESHFKKFEQVLQLSTYFSSSIERIKREALATTDGADDYHLLYVVPRNGSYLHVAANKDFQIQQWYGPVEEVAEEDILRASERMLLGAYEFLLLSTELNVVVKNHLPELICTDNYDHNLEFCGVVGDPVYHQQLLKNIRALKPWHRAVLFGIGTLMGAKNPTPWYKRMWEGIKDVLYKAYSTEISQWPVPLKITCGIVLVGIVGAGFWKTVSVLTNAGNGAGLVGAAVNSFSVVSTAEAQSRKPNRFEVQQYRYKNVPLTRRSWGNAQMSLDQSTVSILNKCHAKFIIASQHAQIVLVPGRRFIGYSHFFCNLKHPLMVQIETADRTYFHRYQPENMEYIEDSELCVYHSPCLEDISHSCWDLFCWDPDKELPKKFSADFVSCKYNTWTKSVEPTWANVDAEVIKEDFTICDGEYRNTVSTSIRYEAPTVMSDCGSMIITNVGGKTKIVGIHVAGRDNRIGMASLLPPLLPCAQAQGAEKYFNFYPMEYDAAEGIARVGELKPKLYIPLPKKTSLVKTPEEWHLGTPCDKVPSILVKGDPRLADTVHADYDPCLSGLTKYSTPMSPLDSVLLGETCQEILDEWFDCLPEGFELGEVTINEALNGVDGVDYMDRIPLATSEGFPHVMSREQGEKGKQRFVQGDGHIVSLIPGTSVHEAYETLSRTIATEVPTLVGIECPKDEKLPFRKVFTKPKTRNFTILPMEYNILVRQYFLNFVRFIMKKRDVLPCQVGINPYSMEWSIVASRLKSQGNDVLCCDYSSFDGLLSKQIMEMMADMINRFCGGGTIICAKRKNLLMACCSRLAISRDSVWRVECGIPSGFPLTVICNSIFNEILVRYHYKLLLQEHNAPNMYVQSFKNLISMVTYGDDNLISVNAVVKPYFDGTKLKQAMARNGIIITDGKDKTSATLEFRRLEDCDFLKRGFLKRSSVLWDAPEEKASLWAQLHYVNVNNCEMQVAYMTNLVNVLRELYMHDPTEMVEFRRLALKSIPWLNTTDLPTLYQVKEFYAEQRLRNIPDHNDSLDMLTSVDLLGPAILGEGVPQEALVLSKLLEVRDLRYHTVPDNDNDKEVWILFNTMYPQKLLPSNCHSFTWNCGQGRGGLPTQHWLATNVTRTDSKLNKLIRTAVAANKKIVLATKDNILPINIIAVLLAARNKVMPSLATNALLTYVIGAAKKLNFLTTECQFAFFNV